MEKILSVICGGVMLIGTAACGASSGATPKTSAPENKPSTLSETLENEQSVWFHSNGKPTKTEDVDEVWAFDHGKVTVYQVSYYASEEPLVESPYSVFKGLTSYSQIVDKAKSLNKRIFDKEQKDQINEAQRLITNPQTREGTDPDQPAAEKKFIPAAQAMKYQAPQQTSYSLTVKADETGNGVTEETIKVPQSLRLNLYAVDVNANKYSAGWTHWPASITFNRSTPSAYPVYEKTYSGVCTLDEDEDADEANDFFVRADTDGHAQPQVLLDTVKTKGVKVKD
ncbi:hypothetical protein [Bifidobacterium sp. ESL0745]|uniref:hypothetical protein n=1 Tax=Bifidobacterium sp. ESL0745 TaxID=2983226 RepID=UPI0023F6529C|nr:hypothetical protein [Bifidobacterium sp. ESL0745]MDF7666121.1 hypothetical protein [Bifidobacterium sp. ESL0745]